MPNIPKGLEGYRSHLPTVYAMIAAFAAYASMYAFRKPFTATGYEGLTAFTAFGVAFSYKPIAIIAQLLGYMSSKFIGIKVASEASMRRRVPTVLGLILFAECMLLLFALTPAPYNILFLFLNGLPLGMVWSLLFGILEGRKVTEFLGLAMSVSVIFASGIVKGVGRWTMEAWQVTEFWMPVTTGLLFIPLLLLSLYMLHQVPPPTEEDIALRTERRPMRRSDRRYFLRTYFPGVLCLMIGYLCLMTYRDLRDSFMDLILADLGYEVDASTFASIETTVGVCVIALLCVLYFVKSNRMAVWVNLGLVAAGAIMLGSATILLQQGVLGPRAFYLVNGIGLYIAFVPYQSILMDRLLASLHTVATASFLVAIADSYGYLSTVSLYLARDIFSKIGGVEIKWITMLNVASYVVMVVVPLMVIGVVVYFKPRLKG
jgi:hypothetical protein